LERTDWWKADFTKQIDLLEKLYAKYSAKLPAYLSEGYLEAHSSVQPYIKKLRVRDQPSSV